ncbi:thiol-disulfide oxidoreductase DCC family protein [Cytobacillus massiliigabonensis]|uniref:thiol-disulfide oxidoreductase DCC family protein n=1 Tax=Cytobacillus massiliigabonensis TaxID=1871011 RepID=UPI001F331074|nr:DUF393 domain-containing protein [Cytobacillus massiliigabonensis]
MIFLRTTALYDRTCTLCKESKRMFTKLDWFRQIDWVSLQEYEKNEQAFAFDKASLRKELHIITSNGHVLKGFYAIRYLFLRFPLFFLLGAFLYLPFSYIIGNPIYQWIAKNRHKFLKRKCEDGSCSL